MTIKHLSTWKNDYKTSTQKNDYKTSITMAILQKVVTTLNDEEDAEKLGNMHC